MAEGNLYLVRHAHTQPGPQPVELWGLSDLGQQQAGHLAEHAFWSSVQLICTSTEPKAFQTAQVVAARHDLPLEPVFDLHELRRPSSFAGDYEQAVRQVLANPAASFNGWEPAGEAQTRILVAIERLLQLHEGEKLAVVSHGLVLTLYLARLLGVEPTFDLWKSAGFASVVEVDTESQSIVSRLDV